MRGFVHSRDSPGGAWRVTFSPIASAIAQAAGAVIESDKSGALTVRYLWPVNIPDWPAASPDHILTDEADNLSIEERLAPTERFNEVTLRDFDLAAGLEDYPHEWVESADPLRGDLLVYPWPFAPVDLAHTGHAGVGLAPVGQRLVSHVEEVEFAAGRASVRFPVDSVVSVAWRYSPLGPVTATGRDLTASGGGGYSLAAVTYTARACVFTLSNSRDENIQFLVMR